MDFTSAFKSDTRAGKSLGKKKAKKPRLADEIMNENREVKDPSKVPRDLPKKPMPANPEQDDANRDPEDDNFLPNDLANQELDPEQREALMRRDLKITQADMAQRKVLDLRRWFCMARP